MATPTPTPATVIPSSSSSTLGSSVSANGTTTIKEGVVSKVAGIAARSVAGVHDLGGGAARAIGALRGAINQNDLTQGISVEVGETQVAVDVSLVAEYPVPLQGIADDVRAAVTNAIEDLVGMQVTEVNVTINDVHLPSDDKDSDSESRVL